jgi:hypothetical protein
MFAQMRGKSRPSKQCVCLEVCPCHDKEESLGLLAIGILLIAMMALIVSLLCSNKAPEKSIEVNGQSCKVRTVIDSVTSTGGVSHSHDVADCDADGGSN